MSAIVDDRNPTGFVPTQAQRDELERQGYWNHAIEYGLDYYVAGRFATAHHFSPVSANILHHAVELLLKACLAHDDSVERIREYGRYPNQRGYGHDLRLLWRDFKARQPAPVPAEFDAVIEGLHDFEDIRYPERLIRDGATISIGLFETNGPPILRNGQLPENLYVLQLPQIDRLMGLLFAASQGNAAAFLPRIENDKQALAYYDMVRPTLFGRRPQDAPGGAAVSVSPGAAAKYSLIRAISGSMLIVGLALTFVERRYAPNSLVTDDSTILPAWVGWTAYLFALVAALAYNVTDYVEWWNRRKEMRA